MTRSGSSGRSWGGSKVLMPRRGPGSPARGDGHLTRSSPSPSQAEQPGADPQRMGHRQVPRPSVRDVVHGRARVSAEVAAVAGHHVAGAVQRHARPHSVAYRLVALRQAHRAHRRQMKTPGVPPSSAIRRPRPPQQPHAAPDGGGGGGPCPTPAVTRHAPAPRARWPPPPSSHLRMETARGHPDASDVTRSSWSEDLRRDAPRIGQGRAPPARAAVGGRSGQWTTWTSGADPAREGEVGDAAG